MTKRRTGWAEDEQLLFVLIAALLAMSAVILFAAGLGIDGVRMLIRATARSSLLIFAAAFAASSLVRLWPGPTTRWAIRNRRWLGLGFAFSHLLHGIAIIWLFGAFGDQVPPPKLTALAGGGLAYVFILLLAATSFDGAVRRLGGKNWRRLHWTGVWYIWLIFMVSYGGRAATDPDYWPPALLLLAVAGLRIIAAQKRRTAV